MVKMGMGVRDRGGAEPREEWPRRGEECAEHGGRWSLCRAAKTRKLELEAWTARWMPKLPRGREENWTPTAETGEVACDLTLPVPLSQPCNGFITALHTALSYPQISRIFAGRRCLIDSRTPLGFLPAQHDAPTRWGCHRHSWWDDRHRPVHVHALCVCCRDSAHSGMYLSCSMRKSMLIESIQYVQTSLGFRQPYLIL